MSKRVDPVDRAIDAVLALNETQRAVFDFTIRRMAVARAGAPQPEKRAPGRPAGSRNKAKANGAAVTEYANLITETRDAE